MSKYNISGNNLFTLSKKTMTSYDPEDIHKSDKMICNHIAYNQFQWRKDNDLIFYHRMGAPQNSDLMDRCAEDKMRMGFSRACEVSQRMFERGGNSTNCEPKHFAKGFLNYNKYHLNEWMMAPCPENTWRNYLVSDNEKTCSKKHQVFMNVTKRSGIPYRE